MKSELQLRVTPCEAASELILRQIVSTRLDIDANRICELRVVRRSIDARQRRVKVNLTVEAYIDTPPEKIDLSIDYKQLPTDAAQAIVVGAGPAGLFAALRLIELGVKPIVVERGKDVDSRRRDTAAISRTGAVDADSNYCFGEGGAGAFSDGKLFTRSKKRGNVGKILNILHQHGAQPDILVDAHPHIGTDRLPEVIKAIRETIIRCGGEVRFGERVSELIIDGDEVKGVKTSAGAAYSGPVILATGHSARDVYKMLVDAGVGIEAKGIAVGVRLEHPQELIDRIRYHSSEGRGKWLPAAEYTMLTRVDGRAVYSFCMCPGGVVVPAASAPGEIVVNGMSSSSRGSRWANSGMVVEVLPEDLGDEFKQYGPLAMMKFQESIERRFFEDGDGTQNVAAQRMTDFVEGRLSDSLPRSSYAPGLHSARVDKLLPEPVARRLQQGFREFDRKNRGFLTPQATVIGDETRTSAPVRIPRDRETFCHPEVKGLFPCGEGAGFAGGIVSAAIDGENCATCLADYLRIR